MTDEKLSQAEWERLVKVWRTRADEEFQRAERAEAAYERARAQANDALNRAAELQQHADQLQAALDQAQGRQTELEAENARLREATERTTAALIAAISLLEGGGKEAAPSDKMFWQMIRDYRNALEDARTALAQQTDQQTDQPEQNDPTK